MIKLCYFLHNQYETIFFVYLTLFLMTKFNDIIMVFFAQSV